jgi:hypothetical protein
MPLFPRFNQRCPKATLIKGTFYRNSKTETRRHILPESKNRNKKGPQIAPYMALQITRIFAPKFPFNL